MRWWLSLLQLLLLALARNGVELMAESSSGNDDVGGNLSQRFDYYYGTAVDYIQKGEYITGLQLLRKASELKDDDVETNQLIGTISLKLGDLMEGLEYLIRANLDSNGLHPGIIANLIEAYRMAGQLQEARNAGRSFLNLLETQQPPLHETLISVYTNLGLVEKQLSNYPAAAELFHAVVQTDPGLRDIWVSLADCLMHFDHPAAEALMRRAVQAFPRDVHMYYLLGTALHHQLKLDDAMMAYSSGERINATYYPMMANMAAALQSLGRIDEAIVYYHHALEQMPDDPTLVNNYGALMGIMGRKEEEVAYLEKALRFDPYMESALVNLASYYQGDGQLEIAAEYLERAANVSKTATLLRIRIIMMLSVVSMSWEQMLTERHRLVDGLLAYEEEYKNKEVQRHSLETSFDHIHFYLVYHGLNDRRVQELITQVYHRHVEIGTVAPFLMHPQYPSLSSMQDAFRSAFFRSNFDSRIISKQETRESAITAVQGAQVVDQELSLQSSLSSCASSVSSAAHVTSDRCRIRVGFISKFFALFEPHGMLLDGVMRYLPRDKFEVIVMPIARSDGKPLSPPVVDAAAVNGRLYPQRFGAAEQLPGIIEVSLTYAHALEMLQQLQLDILIFGDVMSEPIAHFLAFARVAPIQLAFWGNPITSASQHMDYFVSSAGMEHPYRTRMLIEEEPYTEQVVLLDGQGIWYYRPAIEEHILRTNLKDRLSKPKAYSRSYFGYSDDWFIYFLPQSVFKIHPLFDQVLADILRLQPSGHLVVTGGRQPRWTEMYLKRLTIAIGEDISKSRLHFIERVSSEQFDEILKLADVILHPFPFDGSRTSADALYSGKPLVTLPTEYLRGRMGLSFMRTLNLPELVARNASHYVDIAVRLCSDRQFHRDMSTRIKADADLIWEDLEVVYEWTQLLQTVYGIGGSGTDYLTWDNFLHQTGRNFTEEQIRHERRVENRKQFDASFGSEHWLLDENGIAVMETDISIESRRKPRIFENWGSSSMGLSHRKSSAANMGGGATNAAGNVFANDVKDSDVIYSSVPLHASNSRLYTNNMSSVRTTPWESPPPLHLGSVKQTILPNMLPRTATTSTIGIDTSTPLQIKPRFDAGEAKRVDNRINLSRPLDYVEIAKQGHYDKAYELAIALYSNQHENPIYLMELAAIQYFRGYYKEAHDICTKALPLAPDASLLHACLGVTAMYLPDVGDRAVDAFERAVQLMRTKSVAAVAKGLPPFIDRRSIPTEGLFNSDGEIHSVVFSISLDSIEGNLMQSYRIHKKYSQCLHWCAEQYRIPAVGRGGEYILVFALVDWSPERYSALDELEQVLRSRGKLQLPVGTSLRSEVERIQETAEHIINPANECMNGLDAPSVYDDALEAMTILVFSSERDAQLSALANTLSVDKIAQPQLKRTDTNIRQETNDELRLLQGHQRQGPGKGIALIAQYFRAISHPVAQADIDQVLTLNLLNDGIDDIYLLNEETFDFSMFPRATTKLHQYVVNGRLTFQEAVRFANQHLSGRTVIIANADIYFDYSILRLSQSSAYPAQSIALDNHTVLALLRWSNGKSQDINSNSLQPKAESGEVTINLRIDSQDAWIFKAPLRDQRYQRQEDDLLLDALNFPMGVPRCDNRLAFLLKQANYTVLNPAFAIRAIEQQSIRRIQHIYDTKNSVLGAVSNVLLSDKFAL